MIYLALPREAREVGDLNGLGKGLGKLGPIEFQCISESAPKPLAAQTLGHAGGAIYKAINICSDPSQLDKIGGLIWQGWGDGSIGDDEAQYLSSCIEYRRPLRHRTAAGYAAPMTLCINRVSNAVSDGSCLSMYGIIIL